MEAGKETWALPASNVCAFGAQECWGETPSEKQQGTVCLGLCSDVYLSSEPSSKPWETLTLSPCWNCRWACWGKDLEMLERPKAAVLQGRSSWSSSRQPRRWRSWQLSTPSLLGAPLLLPGTWDPPHRPRLWCSTVRRSSAAPQRGTCSPRTAEAHCEQRWEGFSRGSVHKFTTNLVELEKLREL